VSGRAGELGNLNREFLNSSYQGVAMTLIDSLSSLAVLGNRSEFAKNVYWLSRHVRRLSFACIKMSYRNILSILSATFTANSIINATLKLCLPARMPHHPPAPHFPQRERERERERERGRERDLPA
jgi:hypothetical protein